MKSELKAWHVTEKTWPEKVIRILPEGIFEIIPMAKRGIHNCKYCWFGQKHKEPTHCPNDYRCSFDDGTAIIFKKVGEITMNDKKKPEPKDFEGIMIRVTGAIESIIKRQDTISNRINGIEARLDKLEEKRNVRI